jgi:hypothetical protein
MVTQEFEPPAGGFEIDIVLPGNRTRYLVDKDMSVFIRELGEYFFHERPNRRFRHEDRRGEGAGVVFKTISSNICEFLFDLEALFDAFAARKNGWMDQQMGEFLTQCKAVFLFELHVVDQVRIDKNRFSGCVDEGVGLPTPG